MCCTVRGDLLGAFTAILAKMDSRRPLDAVLLETTGMADPLPIVRTILQTPTISSSFKLDGVVTLVDAKNIGPRLARAAAEGGDLKAGQVDEAFMQVCFADRIILNKVDLVAAADALEAWELVREINPDAPVLACSRGELHPSEITGFGAFDMSKMIASDPDFASREENAFSREDESHSHAHAHAHGEHCSTECGGGHEDAHSHHDHADGHGDACDERCAEDHESRHSAAVGSFSIVREGFEVDMLLFAQWMRQLATLDPELGLLYRSKALLAAAGSNDKVAFHAVSDVMEKGPTLKWGKGEPRGCKIVFIGKNLRRPWFEEGFDACLLPVKVAAASVDLSLTLKSLKPHLLGHILVYLLSVEVASVSMACQGLWGAVSGDASNELYVQQDCITLQASKPGLSYLHPHLALRSLASYLQAVKKSRVKLPKEGITFQSPTQVEAAGVTWLELAGVDDPVTKSFVVEFRWRPETLADFFATPGASVSSSMVRVEYEYTDEDIDEEVEDTLKFRLVIKPYKEDLPEPDAFELEQYRLYIQTVGGRSCSQVYLLSFGSIHPHFQTHIQVPDHRMPYFETDQTFHKYHPLFAAMRADGFLRFLIRVKPDGSGPLDTLCGCC
jgi:G3E family GTPase